MGKDIFAFIGVMTIGIISVLSVAGIAHLIMLIIESNSILNKLKDNYLRDEK